MTKKKGANLIWLKKRGYIERKKGEILKCLVCGEVLYVANMRWHFNLQHRAIYRKECKLFEKHKEELRN